MSLTQVTILWASVVTETGPEVWNGPITLDLRKLKAKINILRKSDGKKRTKSSDDGHLVVSFRGQRDKLTTLCLKEGVECSQSEMRWERSRYTTGFCQSTPFHTE